MIKGKGQRLIPEELLKYLEAYKEAHPDPTQGGGATLDDIVDSQGNKRFLEGSGTPETVTGMSSIYNKWSLSGTHLMLVFAGKFENNVSIDTEIIKYDLPLWIKNKIFPVAEINGALDKKNVNMYFDTGVTYNRYINVNKDSNGKIVFTLASNIDVTSGTVFFRIQFDLLIDADYE